jgi:hypothetical protein
MITNRFLLRQLARCSVVLALGCAGAASYAQGTPSPRPETATSTSQAYQALFALSQKEQRGLTFYIQGQTIPGVVTKVIGNEAIEVRNQTFGRIIIRVDRVDAVAIN